MYLMIPWVILGIMLAVGLLVSVLYTSINFYVDGDTFNGTLWLVIGLISVGKSDFQLLYSTSCLKLLYSFNLMFSRLHLHVVGSLQLLPNG